MPQGDSKPPEDATAQVVDRLVVIPHLGAGGAQRVASLLLNHWQRNGVRCAVITLFPERDAHSLAPDILREDLCPGDESDTARDPMARLYIRLEGRLSRRTAAADRLKRWAASLALGVMRSVRRARAFVLTHFFVARVAERSSRVRRLRQRFAELRPPVVISFLGATNIQTLLAARGLGLKVIISERNDPALQQLDPPWETLRPRVYPEADLVTANSRGALDTMSRYIPKRKLRQVANPLVVPRCPEGLKPRQPRFISVARLVPQKGYDLLLQAFAQIAPLAPAWRMDIVGDGPLRASLEALAADSGIHDRVAFHGHQGDPFPLLYRAAVFVLPSRFEGMPNAMLEAMGCGLAIIASDASPGPLELIRDNDTGLVVPSENVPALADAMLRLAADAGLRDRLSAAAFRETRRMQINLVAADWDQMCADVASGPIVHG